MKRVVEAPTINLPSRELQQRLEAVLPAVKSFSLAQKFDFCLTFIRGLIDDQIIDMSYDPKREPQKRQEAVRSLSLVIKMLSTALSFSIEEQLEFANFFNQTTKNTINLSQDFFSVK